jgi:UvrD/REP helicase N-terminal domain
MIAGAGTGKTNTLAHRVAHLIVLGADPRRMMLLTFFAEITCENAGTTIGFRFSRMVGHHIFGGPHALLNQGDRTDWLGWQNSSREMVDSVCVAIWSRERVSKLANLSVIETVILSSSAKPYLGAKVQSFREYQPKRESYRFLTRRRSPEVQYPRSQKRALLTITPFCRRTVSGKGLAEQVRFELTVRPPVCGRN